MEHLYAASGDWITLSAAAELVSEKLGRQKNENDILKIGYVPYEGTQCIKIYAVWRGDEYGVLQIANYELRPDTYLDIEKLAVFQPLLPGDVFLLSEQSIERLVLSGQVETKNISAPARKIVCVSNISKLTEQTAPTGATQQTEPPEGCSQLNVRWKHIPATEKEAEFWAAEFACSITPDREISIDDIRIDRQELLEFLIAANTNGVASDDVNKVTENTETQIRQLFGHSTELLLELVAASKEHWKSYMPKIPSTAPKSEVVSKWLQDRGVTQNVADRMATILRPDDLPTGRRK